MLVHGSCHTQMDIQDDFLPQHTRTSINSKRAVPYCMYIALFEVCVCNVLPNKLFLQTRLCVVARHAAEDGCDARLNEQMRWKLELSTMH